MAINWGASSYTLGTYSSGTPFPTNSINSAASGSSFFIVIISFGAVSYTITDNKGNGSGAFVQQGSTSNNTSDGITLAAFLATNVAGGSGHVFSITPAGGSVQLEVYVCEVTGGATSSLVDVLAGPTFGFLGNPSSNPVTTTNANDLILAVFQNNTNPITTFTPGAGFTSIVQSATDGNILVGQVVSATGTYDPSIGFSPSGGRTQMVTIALKAAGGAVVPGPLFYPNYQRFFI
jgi:hypothetical protein